MLTTSSPDIRFVLWPGRPFSPDQTLGMAVDLNNNGAAAFGATFRIDRLSIGDSYEAHGIFLASGGTIQWLVSNADESLSFTGFCPNPSFLRLNDPGTVVFWSGEPGGGWTSSCPQGIYQGTHRRSS